MRRWPVRQAERAGFEPATHLSARTRFPVALLRPLGHLSLAAESAAHFRRGQVRSSLRSMYDVGEHGFPHVKAEGEGFEPSSDPRARNGFRDRRIRPLCHPSEGSQGSYEIVILRSIPSCLWPGTVQYSSTVPAFSVVDSFPLFPAEISAVLGPPAIARSCWILPTFLTSNVTGPGFSAVASVILNSFSVT